MADGNIKFTNTTAPATPPAGTTELRVDSTTKKLTTVDDTGTETEYGSGGGGPMTTQGDIIIGGASGVEERLPIGTADQVLAVNAGATDIEYVTLPASGDASGPASSTDNAVARYDSTTGKLLQNSSVIIDDVDAVTGVTSLTVDNLTVDGSTITSTDTLTLAVTDGTDGLTYAPTTVVAGDYVFRYDNPASAGNDVSIRMKNGSDPEIRVNNTTYANNDITFAGVGSIKGLNAHLYIQGSGTTRTTAFGGVHSGQTISVYDTTATTGVTDVFIRAGAGQSTNELLGVYANDGTTPYFVVVSGNVGIGTASPDTDTILDVVSTTQASRPFPSMTTAQRDALTPVTGSVIYNTTTNVLNFYNGSVWGVV